MRFSFLDFVLDDERRELRRADTLVEMQPQVFDVLLYLVAHRHKVVSKDELVDNIWDGRAVSDAALTTRLNAVRRAIGDTGASQSIIRTIPRKGMRFIGEVKEEALDAPSGAPPLSALDQPSIAVLPFQNISDDPEQEYFADGMVEEIVTALSHIRWLFVIARNSTFIYKGQAIDVKRVGRELGVRYLLEGSVRKGDGRVRITAQLIEAENGMHLWAERFDGSLKDIFDLQDRVASSAAGIIEPTLQAAETERSRGRPTNDLTAYDLYLRTSTILLSSARRIPESLGLLEKAIARDPNYGSALALAAVCHMRMVQEGRSADPDQTGEIAIGLSQRALRAAPDDPGGDCQRSDGAGLFSRRY